MTQNRKVSALILLTFITLIVLEGQSWRPFPAGHTMPSPPDAQATAVMSGVGAKAPSPSRPSAFRERFFTGAAAGDRFGYSVGSADVNGDGYSDLIVGAPFSDAAGADAGCVTIYFGGPITRTTPDAKLTGAAPGERFGSSVAGAGDVNGDGYDDIIVGAPFSSVSGGAGVARVYFGDPLLGILPEGITIRGKGIGEEFGCSVAGAGDVNGDGYADVIVGAWYNDARGTDAGSAYIFFGGRSFDHTADLIVLGASPEDWLGYSVDGAGDVNGDGYADVIVGVHGSDAGGFNAGRAYILFGGAAMDDSPDVTLTGTSALGVFGVSVSGAGDVNGDGLADVAIGAERENLGGADAGRAYVYYGGRTMDTTPDAGLSGGSPGDLFGHLATSAGDVNGDGYGDVLVCANWNDAAGLNAGRAYLYFGGSIMDEIADGIFTGAAQEDFFGQSAACAGDVNGDGLSDLIVGADYNDAGGLDAGRAYLYTNSLTGSDIPDLVFTGEGGGDQLGYALDGVGDVNGDGFGDMVIGAWSKYGGTSQSGYAWLSFGGPELSAQRKLTLQGEMPADYFGVAIARAGDVNGDGLDDVIIGASHYGASGMGEGRAYLYLGGSSMDAIPDVVFVPVGTSSGFGTVVAGAGDVNSDGFADVLIGTSVPPAVRLYLGGATMDNSADLTFTRSPTSAAGAGDFNGDGYDDVIIGWAADDNGGTHTGMGSAYVYFGGVAMDATADLILWGETDKNGFGYSVTGAGDLNGDGFDDIAIGAPFNDAVSEDAGRVYVFYGGLTSSSTPDVVMQGRARFDRFGDALAMCGDVNADGFGDLIVGASSSSAGGQYAGQAFVFFGGAWMDEQPDLTFTGTEAAAEFGIAVAGAGDVNGDHRADLLVGAVNGGNGGLGIGPGKAFLYISSGPPIVPRIMSVQDVPEDQGGEVLVRWVRSGHDTRGQNWIAGYLVERSMPPDVSGFAWEKVALIEATNNPQYLFTAPTWQDAMAPGSGTAFFRVTAITYNPMEYWRSNIVAGSSRDNLAPLSPRGASLLPLSDGRILISWQKNTTDGDVGHFAVYRSRFEGFQLADTTFLCSTRDTTATDSSTQRGATYFYRVTCVDIHGNESAPTAQLSGVVVAAAQGTPEKPHHYELRQNYPNPFNPRTSISFALPERAHVVLSVYDLLGREVVRLVDETLDAGEKNVAFDAKHLASGVYFYRLNTENFTSARKLLLAR